MSVAKQEARKAQRSAAKTKGPPLVVLTIGHSTRALEDFVTILKAHGVTCVADVRTVPRSRHNPQFNLASLPADLENVGIAYVHLPGLGGLRRAQPDSLNAGWRNASFRGYADYMQTKEFEKKLEELILLAARHRVVLMCAEAVPWRCHRSLIGDALTVRGIQVEDIMSVTRRQAHKLTPFAEVHGSRISYPADAAQAEPPPPQARSRDSGQSAKAGKRTTKTRPRETLPAASPHRRSAARPGP